jgi:hypothetical protein
MMRAAKRSAPVALYPTVRRAFRSGDLIAQSHGSWSSWAGVKVKLVRMFTLSTWSHVGVIEVCEEDGRVYVVEAVRPAARRVPLSSVGDFYHLPLNARWNGHAALFVKLVIGSPYSEWDAIKAYFIPLPKGTVSECAALARELLERCGVDLGPSSRPDRVVQRALELKSTISFIKQLEPPQ